MEKLRLISIAEEDIFTPARFEMLLSEVQMLLPSLCHDEPGERNKIAKETQCGTPDIKACIVVVLTLPLMRNETGVLMLGIAVRWT